MQFVSKDAAYNSKGNPFLVAARVNVQGKPTKTAYSGSVPLFILLYYILFYFLSQRDFRFIQIAFSLKIHVLLSVQVNKIIICI